MSSKTLSKRKSLRTQRTGWLAGATVAAGLATTAFLVRRSARRAEERHPPIGRFVEINGVRLHYLERGEGPPVLLLHGTGAMLQDFLGSGLLDELAGRYHVIAVDRPGFGYSDRPRSRIWTPDAQAALSEELLIRLGATGAVIVGQSWGTMVAVALALRDPEIVRGLLLIGGYYYPTLRLDAVLLSPPALPVVGDVMRYTISPLLARLFLPRLLRQMFAPKPVPESFKTAMPRGLLLRPWQLRAGAAELAIMAPAAAILSGHYGELNVPITIVAGLEDRIVDSEAQSIRLHHELPGSNLITLPEVGHMAHYAIPRQLATAVDDLFAARQTGAADKAIR